MPLWKLFLLDIKQMFKLGAFSRVNEGVFKKPGIDIF